MIPVAKKYFPEIALNDVKAAVEKVEDYLMKDKTNSVRGLVRLGAEYVFQSLKATFKR